MEIPRVEVLEHRINRKTFKQQRLNRYANGRSDRLQLLQDAAWVGQVGNDEGEAERFVRVGRSFLCWASQTQEPWLSRVR